ncbi:1-phosphatidylinositol-3-phosphate 5-kinase FAB1C [Artemisia annua]|uniref:1-phosphatidylinositol-3-phosphate 5-kinase FAB1C n=1 Tax=Artemisia annua TaxID=35608 RepID=A0A2U1KRL3_ARTAN|nr:1-phosphatidylinositol-3-phosphate 5-kinase FAB1C [Artemisia annua]
MLYNFLESKQDDIYMDDWTAKTIPELNLTMYCCILLDKRGHAIQANIELIDIQKYNSLQLDSAYLIRGFGCQKTERWQQTLSNKIMLLFGKYTQITANGFPEHYFEFVAYNELGKIADDKDSGLTDYIGYVRTIYEKRTTGDATTNILVGKFKLDGNIEMQQHYHISTFTSHMGQALHTVLTIIIWVLRCSYTPSVDKISATRLGQCELFRFEKFSEQHEPANQFTKKPS